jgi:acetyl/propionyl-CoA carboxylase alpha subunit/acetyl-CoA carboxylase carboxyltransferase component
MLKAGNSGGGKGIRIVREKKKCYEMWQEILQEVVNPMIYATTYIQNASHLEIQILGDGNNVIHLHGRDCSTQRRNQKLVEECPIQKSPEIIENIQSYAVKIAKHIGYRGLATVEFIYDQDTEKVYILEVNPRIQVEHIITEQLFGINLLKLLFLVSNGVSIPEIKELQNIDYDFKKHIISVRINSENPYEEFRPTLGEVIEIDITYNQKSWGYFSVSNNSIISEQVDSQFGHISATGENRKMAIQNMTNLIDGLKIRGTIYNTASFLKNFINDDVFQNNKHTTKYLNDAMNTQLFNTKYNFDSIVVIGMLYNSIFYYQEKEKNCIQSLSQGHNYLLNELNHFQKSLIVINHTLFEYEFLFEVSKQIKRKCLIRYHDKIYTFDFDYNNNTMNIILKNKYLYTIIHSYHDEYQMEVLINQLKYIFIRKIKDNKILSQASGKVIECVLPENEIVNKGDIYIKIECMKMIMSFKIDNSTSGKIHYFVKSGDVISTNQVIGEIEVENHLSTKSLYIHHPTEIMKNFEENYDGSHSIFEIMNKNKQLLNIIDVEKQPSIFAIDYPSFFSSNYTLLFDDINTNKRNSNGYVIKCPLSSSVNAPEGGVTDFHGCECGSKCSFVLLVNDLKINNGVFSYSDDEYYYQCLRYAREHKYPFVFIASNSGAEIKINENLKYIIKPYIVNNEFRYFFLEESEYEKYKEEVVVKYHTEHNHYEITCIRNPGIINLDGSALLVSEMAKARNEIQTITFVVDRTVGVGAYLARLSERIIQRKDSCILLTGYQSINKVLGHEIYESNLQLGGYNVMSNNGISHKIVETTMEGIHYIQSLLNGSLITCTPMYKNISSKLPKVVTDIIDTNTFIETMDNYAKNVVTGRCRIHNKKYGIIYAVDTIVHKFIPCDPADLSSYNKTLLMSPNILYPDTSYKIAKTIRDCNIEGISLFILADWRGFSGGTRDMYENVLDFGSMIVSELAYYKQKVTIYIPPKGQLRGGSMVVFSKSIHKENIQFYVSSTANINVLEPNATKELKYKSKDKVKYSEIHNISDEKMMETIAMRYVELNDCISPEYISIHTADESSNLHWYKILNKYEPIIDGIVEPNELRNRLIRYEV